MDDKLKYKLTGALWGLAVLIVITLLCGCKTVRYVPVETVRTDSVYLMDSSVVNTIIHYKDSLRIKDSIVIVVDTAGNVLSKEKYHDERRTKDTGRSINETKAKEKEAKSADSVQIPVSVEKPLDWWQQTRLKLFWPLVAVVVVLAVAVWWMVRMARKK